MRTQSRNPSVIKIGLAEGQTNKCETDTQLQEFHPNTRVPPDENTKLKPMCDSNRSGRRPDWKSTRQTSNYKSSNPTTGVPFLLQEFLSYYRSSNPTTGVPFLLQEFHPATGVPFILQEFLSYYRSSNRTKEFQSYYRSSIQLSSQRSSL